MNHTPDLHSGEEADQSVPTPPSQSNNLSGPLARFAQKALFLLTLAAPTTTMNTGCISGCDGPDVVDTDEDEVIKSAKVDGYTFDAYRAPYVQINNDHGNTLFHFIRGELQNRIQVPAGVSEQSLIDGVIALCRELNPGINLDNFNGINDQNIVFPDAIRITKEASARTVRTAPSSEEEMLDAAKDDGFDVRKTKNQEGYYDEALRTGIPVPTEGPYFFRKGEDVEHSPAKMAPDAVVVVHNIGKRFHELTGGYQFSYTDVLRDLEAQKKVYRAKGRSVYEKTTHTTGRAIDLPDGRFKDPQGNEFTWKDNPDQRPLIENTLRPLLIQAALENGAIVFVEGTHNHLYIPKATEGDPVDAMVDFGFRGGEEEVVSVEDDDETFDPRDVERSSLEEDLNNAIRGVIAQVEYGDSTEINQRMDILEGHMNAAGIGTGGNWHWEILSKYDKASQPLMQEYEEWTIEQIQAEINKLSTDRKTRKRNQSRINELAEVRDTKMYYELIELIQMMRPEDVERTRPFRGTVFDAKTRRKKTPYHFANLQNTWATKRAELSESEWRHLFDHTRADLQGRDHSVDMQEWFTTQQAACDYLRAHGETLGYNEEMLKYISPAIILAVTHAEFFSEFSGETYMRIAPALFEGENLVFGPAMNDKKYSAGVVQMIRETGNNMVGSKRTRLQRIQESDPSYQIIVPGNVSSDPHQFTKAMVTDTKSQFFYGALGVAYHMELAFNALIEDEQFERAWSRASEEDRQRFMGSFAAMAINGGRGSHRYNNGAYGASGKMRRKVKGDNPTLENYIAVIPESAPQSNSRRGARMGLLTMDELIRLSEVNPVLAEDAEEQTPDTDDEGLFGWAADWIFSDDEETAEEELALPEVNCEGIPQPVCLQRQKAAEAARRANE